MNAIFDAFWRAAAYCVHPRVILWSLLPLLVAGGLTAGLGWAYWESAVAGVRSGLEQWALIAALMQWLDSIGAQGLRALVAPLVVVALAVPVLVLLSLLLVALLMTPSGGTAAAGSRGWPGRWPAPWSRCWRWCSASRCGSCRRWCWCCRR
jgi:hypothetical protein